MTIKVLNQQEAKAYLSKNELGEMAQPDDPSITARVIEETAKKSKTAQAIYDYLAKQQKTIPVVVVKSDFCGTVYDDAISCVFVNHAFLQQPHDKGNGMMRVPLGVVIFHEFGHAKQAIEKPTWYKLHSSGKDFETYGFFKTIEDDNVSSHEWPICDELNVPRRKDYTDYVPHLGHNSGRAKKNWARAVKQVRIANHAAGLKAAGI